jgi:hypothetical protein
VGCVSGGDDEHANQGQVGISVDLLNHLISTAAPARYQFTETTLTVKLDLAESRDIMAQGGIGFGFGGVVVNAAFAMSFAQEFRAGAEVRTVIHAVLPQDNKTVFDILINRAKELTAVTLPENAKMDDRLFNAVKEAAKVVGAAPRP